MNIFQTASSFSRNIRTGLAALFMVLALGACSSRKDSNLELSGNTMGTTWSLTIPSRSATLADAELYAKVEQRLREINQQFSTWDPDSVISRFNRHASTQPFPVDDEFLGVTEAAQYASKLSNGAFDITMAPLIRLWGFGSDDKFKPPDDNAIKTQLKLTGYQKLSLSRESISKQIPELTINLSAIAKGYAVDEIAALLDDQGFQHYLVEIGGELKAKGQKHANTPWKIAIAKPVPGKQQALQVVQLDNTAVATSGDYNNFFTHEGKRYSHTIDPTSGRPVSHNLTSVTVLHESAMFADAYATALMVMGTDKGMKFAEEHQLAIYMMTRREDGSLSHVTSERFPR